MKKMELKGIGMTTVAIAVLCLLAQPALAAPVVSVEPSYISVLQGENFTVNITVDPGGTDEVMAAQYNLYFNNSLLNATKQEKGPFLSQDGASTSIFTNVINNTLGMTKYGESRTGVDYGVTTPGVLTTISFRAVEPGICSLNLSNVKLSDPLAQPILGVLVAPYLTQPNVLLISFLVSYTPVPPKKRPLSCEIPLTSELLKCSSY